MILVDVSECLLCCLDKVGIVVYNSVYYQIMGLITEVEEVERLVRWVYMVLKFEEYGYGRYLIRR